ncbi:hypothetical protein PCE1_003047 [Barthelona sp. PCE]
MGSNERIFRHLNSTFGSSRIASSAYQKWPTKSSDSTSKFKLSNMDCLPVQNILISLFAPIPKFDDRFVRQNRFGPSTLSFPGFIPTQGIVQSFRSQNNMLQLHGLPPPRSIVHPQVSTSSGLGPPLLSFHVWV